MNEISPIPFQAQPIPASLATDYFAQAESIQAALLRSAQRQKRTAWWVAGAFGGLCTIETLAIAALAPTHTVEWRLIEVDKDTGYVGLVHGLEDAPKTMSDANIRFFVSRYVEARERYIPQLAAEDFRIVSSMSTAAVQRAYADAVNASNKASPQVLLGKDGFIRARVNAVVPGRTPGVAQAFVTLEIGSGDSVSQQKRVLITLTYILRPTDLTVQQQSDNPTGFLVTSYTVGTP